MALALEGTPVHNNATSGSSLVTGAFTTTVGTEVFIVATVNPQGATISSITGGGLTWAKRTSATSVGNGNIEEWAAKATGALSGVQFTINFASSVTFVTSDLFAFSGEDTSTIWDSNGAVPANNTSNPVSISTSNANDAIIAGARMSSTASPTAGTGFTRISGADFQLTEYEIVSATQSGLSCDTGGSAASNGMVADALMQASGGASVKPPWPFFRGMQVH